MDQRQRGESNEMFLLSTRPENEVSSPLNSGHGYDIGNSVMSRIAKS